MRSWVREERCALPALLSLETDPYDVPQLDFQLYHKVRYKYGIVPRSGVSTYDPAALSCLYGM